MSQQQPEPDKRVFPPPDKPVECSCLHCARIYTSDMMIEVEIDGEYHYACPVKGCTAMGWNFDIFSTTEDESEEGSWVYSDDEEEFDEQELTESDGETIAEGAVAIAFDPPRDWSPEVEADDEADDFGEEFEGAEEDALRGTMFTREEYEQLKSDGEYDRKIQEIREHWRSTREDHPPRGPTRPLSDDDIPF